MSLINLENIGKIYTTNEVIAVGIRNITANFDKGEFVAITGKSGSGKSTLLNVIGGIDSYEEGELKIHGESTSHYDDEDLDEYRAKNIAFIFQNYCIIDSFTVIENVEIVLNNINAESRRKKAIEIIKQVGLYEYRNHLGSHLSGGQKQRVSIARALAKDCPIILADEPTGNLDSENSKEIVRLLKEVSKDRLLIMVTHKVDEVYGYATREIKLSDGAISSDKILEDVKEDKTEDDITKDIKIENNKTEETKKNSAISNIKNSIYLGLKLCKSKPKLSGYIATVCFVACIMMFLVMGFVIRQIEYRTADDSKMFNYTDGRVIVLRQDGQAISDEEVAKLQNVTGAKEAANCDVLYDQVSDSEWNVYIKNADIIYIENSQYPIQMDKASDIGKLDVGVYPESEDECVLYLPYMLRDIYGKDRILIENIYKNSICYKVVGIKYYVDNSKKGKMILTDEGFKIATLMAYQGKNIAVKLSRIEEDIKKEMVITDLNFSFETPIGETIIKINKRTLNELEIKNIEETKPEMSFVTSMVANDDKYDEKYDENGVKYGETLSSISAENYEEIDILTSTAVKYVYDDSINTAEITINPNTFSKYIEQCIDKNYRQCSLFYENDEEAKEAIAELRKEGYMAVLSDSQVVENTLKLTEYLDNAIMFILLLVIVFTFVFLFVWLCIRRTFEVIQYDITVIRAMGIKKEIVQRALYFRMIILIIPAVILTLVFAYFTYRTVFGNHYLMYLGTLQYMIIFVCLSAICLMITKKQSTKVFKGTIKNTLMGRE